MICFPPSFFCHEFAIFMCGRTQTAGESTLTRELHTADKEPRPQKHLNPERTSRVAAAARSTHTGACCRSACASASVLDARLCVRWQQIEDDERASASSPCCYSCTPLRPATRSVYENTQALAGLRCTNIFPKKLIVGIGAHTFRRVHTRSRCEHDGKKDRSRNDLCVAR